MKSRLSKRYRDTAKAALQPRMFMKSRHLLGCVLCFSSGTLALPAEESAPPIELKGIVSLSSNQFALLEVTTRPPSANGTLPNTSLPLFRTEMMLARGQRDGPIEVVDIDAPGGKVKIRNGGEVVE